MVVVAYLSFCSLNFLVYFHCKYWFNRLIGLNRFNSLSFHNIRQSTHENWSPMGEQKVTACAAMGQIPPSTECILVTVADSNYWNRVVWRGSSAMPYIHTWCRPIHAMRHVRRSPRGVKGGSGLGDKVSRQPGTKHLRPRKLYSSRLITNSSVTASTECIASQRCV